MEVRFTPSARAQLLEEVVRLRDQDRGRAVALVDDVEDRLRAISSGVEDGREVDGVSRVARPSATGEVRLFYRVRREVCWVLAVLPDTDDDLAVGG